MMNASKPWLSVIGIEEDGFASLSRNAIAQIEQADVIFGGERHFAMLEGNFGKKVPWSSPFSKSIAEIRAYRGKNVVVLATGDPQWFGVGAMLVQNFTPDEMLIIPARSSFTLAASKLAWSLARVQTITLHGRPFANFARVVSPGAKLLVLSNDGTTPARLASYLSDNGFGQSKLHILEHLGGEKERVLSSDASGFEFQDIADLNIVGIECVADNGASWHSLAPGLPDETYGHDGQLTKQVVRAATVSALKPYPGALLWDVGAGCGSIGIEWMRAAPDARALAIEPNPARCEMIATNAQNLGVPGLKIINGLAPDNLVDLPSPDAIFIGGGLTRDAVFETCWNSLRAGGVLVANGVTVESEAYLAALHKQFGGTLTRISVEQVTPMGSFRGWQQLKPVTQWQVFKSGTSI